MNRATTSDGTGIPGGVGGGAGYDGLAILYVAVPNVEAALQKAESLGGKRQMGPARAPTGLVAGHFTDPEGHLIGVAGSAQPQAYAIGASRRADKQFLRIYPPIGPEAGTANVLWGDREMAQSNSGLGDVRNLLGFLVAGFAGVLNVLGLKSGEIGVVLRNEPVRVSVIATFLLAGVLAAVFSIFVTANGHPIPLIVALIFVFLLAAMFSLTIWLVPSPFLGHSAEHYSSIAATVILLACAAFFLARLVRDRRQGRVSWAMHDRIPDLLNLQCLLLAIAVALTSTAAYGALRLETISQTSTVAEIGDTLQVTGQNDLLAISVSASKLSTSEWLGVNVAAVPASWNVAVLCLKPQVKSLAATVGVTCEQDPCYYFDNALNEQCTELSEDVIPPDASGAVQRTLSIPFSPAGFQHVQVTALTCEPNTDNKQPKGTCAPIGAASRLDIAVPPLSAAKTRA